MKCVSDHDYASCIDYECTIISVGILLLHLSTGSTSFSFTVKVIILRKALNYVYLSHTKGEGLTTWLTYCNHSFLVGIIRL